MRKHRVLEIAVVMLFTVILASCASTKRTVLEQEIDNISHENVEQLLHAHTDSIVSFVAKGMMEYTTASDHGTVDVTIASRRRDSMRVDIRGPFGIMVGKLLTTKEHFLFYNTLEARAYEGSLDAIDQLTPFRLPAPALFGDLIIATLPEGAKKNREIHDSTKGTILSFDVDSTTLWYRIDPRTGETLNISLGQNLLEVQFSDYQSAGVPSHSVFRTRDAKIEFRFHEIVLNPGVLPLTLHLPSGIKRTTVR